MPRIKPWAAELFSPLMRFFLLSRKRVLAQLPISAQSYTATPYLDLSLFSYDEKWVSVMERPKACGEQAIQVRAVTLPEGIRIWPF